MPGHDRFADDAHRYALTSRLATGGMGEVWRARDTVLDRPVAVKLLKAEYADDATFRRRFESEARHAASLHHPGIAAVFDFGEARQLDAPADGAADNLRTPRPYLVMELVDGQPLNALLRPGAPMDVEVARDLMIQTAEALGAAHRAGIVHRDVKPGNLIVTPDRRIKVTDFGIARAADGLALTETGQVMGTPAYLAPEQAEGGSATAASDVYSLGVVAFECLAGRRPFTADTPVATALAHLRQPVPELPSSIPADLAAVVTRALAKSPTERYADGSAFAAALRSPAVGLAAPAPIPPPGTGTTQVLPAAAAAPTVVQSGIEPQPTRRGMGAWVPWTLLGAVLVVGGLIIWQLVGTTGDAGDLPPETQPSTQTRSQTEDPTASTPTEQPPEQPTEQPSGQPSEDPTGRTSPDEDEETVEVDPADYIGRDHKDVEKDLRDLDLDVEREEIENPGDQEEGVVTAVEPHGTLAEDDTVVVTYYGRADNDPLAPLTDSTTDPASTQ